MFLRCSSDPRRTRADKTRRDILLM